MDVRCYLDSAGTALPAKEMMVSICEELLSCRLGNPHSVGSAMGNSSMTKVDIARKLVLDHFGLNEYEYDVVFTSGATSSMNIIGQSLCWGESGHVLYPMNSHTSLLGLRDYAPNSSCFSSSALHCGTNDIHCGSAVQSGDVKAVASSAAGVNLLLVPGECNFSGVKADLLKAGQLSIMNQQKLLAHTKAKAVKRGISSENDGCWLWLLDAAKLASSANLDLSTLPTELRPHFVTISFYKIFGYPTGLGALLIRRDSACFLNKRYYGGGTLLAAAADSMFSKAKNANPHEYLEDGTPNFYALAALSHCYRYLAHIGGMRYIEQRTFELTRYLATRMLKLRHDAQRAEQNKPGYPLCTIFGRHDEADVTSSVQGPVIAFTLQWANGTPIGFSEVGRLAAEQGIQLRTGCFCNVGGCQEFLGLSAADVEYNYAMGRVCSNSGHDIVNGKHTGAVRASLGHSNTFEDCDLFLTFLLDNFLNKAPAVLSAPLMSDRVSQSKSLSAMTGSDVDDLCLTTQISVPRELRGTSGNPTEVASTPAATACIDIITAGTIRLAAIFVYPIKSCAGMRVDTWPLCSTGLLFDRAWALVDAHGRAVTQKTFPQLALVQPVINLSDRTMLIRAPGMSEVLAIPLDREGGGASESESDGIQRCKDGNGGGDKADTVSVCGQVRLGRKISFDADQWFGEYLSTSTATGKTGKTVTCTLLRCDVQIAAPKGAQEDTKKNEKEKEKEKENAETSKGSSKNKSDNNGTDISFANTAQFLLLSLESVKALTQLILASNDAARGSLNIKVENFRPNLLVVGAGAAHTEDTWSSIRFTSNQSISASAAAAAVDAVEMNVTGPCSRCSMVNVDGSAGSMDCRAFQALSTYRKDGSSVYFGQFCSLTSSTIEAFDSVDMDRYQDNFVWLSVGAEIHPTV